VIIGRYRAAAAGAQRAASLVEIRAAELA